MKTQYQHSQPGLVILSCMALLVAAVLAGLFANGPRSEDRLIPVLIAALVCVLLFSRLTVTIDSEHILLQMGIGVIRKKIPLDAIASYTAVTNPWYYGWGIRSIKDGVLYNVSGFDAVELHLANGRIIRIGTDEPAKLIYALSTVRRDV